MVLFTGESYDDLHELEAGESVPGGVGHVGGFLWFVVGGDEGAVDAGDVDVFVVDLAFRHEIPEVQLPDTWVLRLTRNVDEDILKALVIFLDDLLDAVSILDIFVFYHASDFPVFEIFFGDIGKIFRVVFDPCLKHRILLHILPHHNITQVLLRKIRYILFPFRHLRLIEE